MKGNIGTNTSTVVYKDTLSQRNKKKKKSQKRNKSKNEGSKKCIGCESIGDGFCKIHGTWCYNARKICDK